MSDGRDPFRRVRSSREVMAMRTNGFPRIRSVTGGDVTSTLLLAAMLVPIVSALLGWSAQTPLGVPLWLHATLTALVAFLVAVPGRRERSAPPARAIGAWVWPPLLGTAFALVLHERANVFYTESALVEGMALLALIDVGVRLLRARALHQRDLHVVPGRASTNPLDARWRTETTRRPLPATPAVRLADRLVTLVGWLVLASWVLIALEHRHPAGPMLLFAGALEALALVVLVPDSLVASGWVRQRAPSTGEQTTRRKRFVLLRGGTKRSPHVTHLLRRHS